MSKHRSGDLGNADADDNEKGMTEGTLVLSRYRTLFGRDLHVLASLKSNETVLFRPTPSSNTSRCPTWRVGIPTATTEPEMKPNYGEVSVHSIDMGGWVRLHTDRHSHNHPDLAIILGGAHRLVPCPATVSSAVRGANSERGNHGRTSRVVRRPHLPADATSAAAH
jgi:hypothetical protein